MSRVHFPVLALLLSLFVLNPSFFRKRRGGSSPLAVLELVMSISLVVLMLSLLQEHMLQGTPVVFQDDGKPATFIKSISQIESDGTHIYVRDDETNSVKVLDSSGRFMKAIGGLPKFKQRVSSMALGPGTLWLSNDREEFFYLYVNHEYELMVDLPVNLLKMTSMTTNAFAASADHVVIPVHPKRGYLGVAFDFDGNQAAGLGRPFPFEPDILNRNPWWNDTLWCYDSTEKTWVCLYKYHPIVIVFYEEFRELRRVEYSSPEVDKFMEKRSGRLGKSIEELSSGGGFTAPVVLNFDLKVDDDYYYVMAGGALLKLGKASGEVAVRAKFKVPHDGEVRSYSMEMAAPISDELLAVGHASHPFDADFWFVQNPAGE